jgi:hypothetical protein
MTTVIENQSLLDIAIQEGGSVLTAFDLALENGLSITDVLEAGQKLVSPNSSYRKADVANYFKGKNQMVATGFDVANSELTIPEIGIGTMTIGTNFIVA